MGFEFATASRIIFGEGSAGQVAQLAGDLGSNVLLFTDDQPQRVSDLIGLLGEAGIRHTLFPVTGEPSVEVVNRAKDVALSAGCDLVISIGGGSVIDSGKAAAALIPNEGAVLDYLEVIGKGQKLKAAPLPFIALPTTAGTGAEVTKNAVLASHEKPRQGKPARQPYAGRYCAGGSAADAFDAASSDRQHRYGRIGTGAGTVCLLFCQSIDGWALCRGFAPRRSILAPRL